VPALEVKRSALGIEFDRRLVIGDGRIELASCEMRAGAADVSRDQFRVELQRPLVIGDGPGVIMLREPRVAAQIEKERARRVDPDGFIEIGNGAIEVRLGPISARPCGVEIGELTALDGARADHARAGGNHRFRCTGSTAVGPIVRERRAGREGKASQSPPYRLHHPSPGVEFRLTCRHDRPIAVVLTRAAAGGREAATAPLFAFARRG
jgi:hypothetical protein